MNVIGLVAETNAVGAVVTAWDRWWDDKLHEYLAPDCCVLAARTCIRVLAELGVPAHPLPTQTAYYNAEAARLWQAEVPIDVWPASAWAVGTSATPTPRADGVRSYAGHVWAATEHFLIDLSARQFHRPGLIIVEASLVSQNRKPPPFTIGHRDTGQIIVVTPNRDRSFINSRDWRENYRPLTDGLLERARHLLATQRPADLDRVGLNDLGTS